MNTRLPLKNILLLALSASLLNVSLSLALPAQPPANGALTPNFTNVDVDNKVTATELEIGEITSKNPANDVVFMDGVEIRGDILATNISAEDEVYTSWLYANNLRSRTDADPITLHDDLEVDGTLKTDRIEMLNNDGLPVRFGADVFIEDRLQVEDISYLEDLDVSGNAQIDGELDVNLGIISGQADLGSLRVSSITRSGNPNNEITVNSPVNVNGRFEINGTNLLTYLKNRIYSRQGAQSNALLTTVACPLGQIAISCGAKVTDRRASARTSSRLVQVYRNNSRCDARWADTAYLRSATAICFDYR